MRDIGRYRVYNSNVCALQIEPNMYLRVIWYWIDTYSSSRLFDKNGIHENVRWSADAESLLYTLSLGR